METKKIEILHIDDNDLDIMLTQEAFQDSNYKLNLSSAQNGEEGLAYLKKQGSFSGVNRPDLILLDLNMPVMNGREFLQFIKTDEEFKSIPIVILTTSDSKDDVDFCYKNYANAFVTKSIDFISFQESIKKLEEFWFGVNKMSF